MSMFGTEKQKCFLCGAESEFRTVLSTNAFGPTDLDTRPPEMQRSTMPCWVQSCPRCGYTAGTISDRTGVGKAFIEGELYRTCDDLAFDSRLAEQFYRYYLILAEDGKKEKACTALLNAAWACDDAGDRINAAWVREKAAGLAEELLAADGVRDRDLLCLIHADLMRRASLFQKVVDTYGEKQFEVELYNRVMAFEVALAREKEAGCYTVRDAVENPAP